MKKITLLSATMLSALCLGGSVLPVEAGGLQTKTVNIGGNRILVTYGSSKDCSSLLEQLQSCLRLPGQVILPGCELPEWALPGVDCPEGNVPEVDKPETNVPEIDVPELDTPEGNIPGNDGSEADEPEVDKPETNRPEVDQPETNLPSTPNDGNGNIEQPGTDVTPEQGDNSLHAYILQVVDLVNAERAKEGLSVLTLDTRVQAAAQVRAEEILTSFSHTRPNGTSFSTALKEQNVSYRSAGENIAWGQRSPEEVVNAWMNSAGHRANIMNSSFTTIGVGYYQNNQGTNYWSQLFTS